VIAVLSNEHAHSSATGAAGDGILEDMEDLDPTTADALLALWQGLIGSALQLVTALQAVSWNGGCDLLDCNTSSLSTAVQAAAEPAADPGSQLGASDAAETSFAAAGGKDGGGGSDDSIFRPSADSAHGRLQEMQASLTAALDPSSAPLATSTAVLAELEALAVKATAAGSNAEALVQLLLAQQVPLPPWVISGCTPAPSTAAHLTGLQVQDAETLQDCRLGEELCRTVAVQSLQRQLPTAICSAPFAAALHRVSLATEAMLPQFSSSGSGSGGAVTGLVRQCSQTSDLAARSGESSGIVTPESSPASPVHTSAPSLSDKAPAAEAAVCTTAEAQGGNCEPRRSRKKSLLGRKNVSFFLSVDTHCSNDGGSGQHTPQRDSMQWSLSGGRPDQAGMAAAAAARIAAMFRRLTGDPPATGGNEAAAAAVKLAGDLQTSNNMPPSMQACTAVVVEGEAQQSIKATTATAPYSTGTASRCDDDTADATVGGGNEAVSGTFVAANLPPLAVCASQHMIALQAVLREAVSLVRSWQQQRVLIALLQQRLKEVSAAASCKQQRLLALMEQLEQMQREQQQQQPRVTADRDLAEQVSQLQQQLGQLKAEKQQLAQFIEQLQVQLQTAAAAACADRGLLTEQLSRLQSDLIEAQESQQQLVMANEQLQQQLQAALAGSAARVESDQLAAQLADLQQQLLQLQADKQRLQDAQELLQHQLQQELQRFAAVETASSADQQQAEAKLHELLQQVDQLLLEKQQLEAANQQLQQQLDAARAAAAASGGCCKQLQQQLEHLQQEMQGAGQDQATLKQQLVSCRAELEHLKAEHAEALVSMLYAHHTSYRLALYALSWRQHVNATGGNNGAEHIAASHESIECSWSWVGQHNRQHCWISSMNCIACFP
jgi:hypothetical protein